MTPKNMNDLMAVRSDSNEDILGKMTYFNLSSLLIPRAELELLCENMGIPTMKTKRLSYADAFRSATGDVYQRLICQRNGRPVIFKLYFRDNDKEHGYISRELIKEELGRGTNQYTKLANIRMARETGIAEVDNLDWDPDIVPEQYCEQAKELYALYQTCANSKHVKTLLEHYLSQMEAIKIIRRGNMYFVPKNHMHELELFESFIDALNDMSVSRGSGAIEAPLTVNSMFVVDDEKQRQKMAESFYTALRKDISFYMDRINHLIQSGCESRVITQRWVAKVSALRDKIRLYEETLHQDLQAADSDVEALKYLMQELQVQTASPLERMGNFLPQAA
jgi:hypothetical protein